MSFFKNRFSSTFYRNFLIGFGGGMFPSQPFVRRNYAKDVSVEAAWMNVGAHLRQAMAFERDQNEKANRS